jgi:hypothetical protein
VRSASLEERERVDQVVQNAQEQLLRAKGQVARLQQGALISSALSPEARTSHSFSHMPSVGCAARLWPAHPP